MSLCLRPYLNVFSAGSNMFATKMFSCSLLLRGVESSVIIKAMMSQRQVRKPKAGSAKQVYSHKDVIEEYQQKAYEKMVATDGKLTKHEISQLSFNNPEVVQRIQSEAELKDMPIPGLHNPFAASPRKCLLCEHKVELDYKNVRLLSQFVSPHTGRIYGRDRTGLCIYMQRRVSTLIKRARVFGFMAYKMKKPEYITDPKLFDPFRGPINKKV